MPSDGDGDGDGNGDGDGYGDGDGDGVPVKVFTDALQQIMHVWTCGELRCESE